MLFNLQMTNVSITKMTDKLTTLLRLEDLTLNGCSLTQLPNLSPMFKLNRLSVPHNRLTKIDGLVGVSHLWLDHNLLTEIPTLMYPEELYMLSMNNNPVMDMQGVLVFSNITSIKLSKTEVSAIPYGIYELSDLSDLEVTYSKLTSIPQSIVSASSLYYLIIYGNPFSAAEINSIKAYINGRRPDIQILV